MTMCDYDDLPDECRPISNVRPPNEEPLVALTFDDGPSKWTSEILELLDREQAKATFPASGEETVREGGPLPLRPLRR
jgi:peptidoglycan-N-acetylglucosamine deacetylase